MKAGFAAFAVLAATACGLDLDIEGVRQEFAGAHPDAIVHGVVPGEGDFENVYIHIRYSEAGEPKEAVWLYQKLNDRWVNTQRGSR